MNSRNGTVPRRRVVVSGLGAVTPVGIGAAAFADALRRGASGIDKITLFDPQSLPCRIAGEVKNFLPGDYLPARTLKRIGRVVPFAIAAAKEALDGACVALADATLQERRTWGLVLGSGGGAPDFTEEQYRLFFNEELHRVSAYNVSSSTMGTISSEISLYYDLHGASHMISTGCTSSTDAIGYAFNMIRFGLADHLITGGVDATITPGIMQGFCVMQAVSTLHNDEPQRASRPFDRSRDGFVLGEGAWLLVLEDRELALTRGAPVLAEILGYGSTCDAYHRVQLDPSGDEPARAMTIAIEDAGVAKDEIGYLAAHGTATLLNDRTETLAVKKCFARRAYEIPISSIKSMIGHPQGASGAAGVAAAILGMNHGFLPPTINYGEADPECDLDYVPNHARSKGVDLALCNCIGFGSKNSALVIARGNAA